MGTSGTPLEYRYSALNSFEAGQTVALPVDAGVRDVLGQTSDHLVGAGGHPCPQLRVPEGGPGDFRRRTGDLGVMYRADLVPKAPGALVPERNRHRSRDEPVRLRHITVRISDVRASRCGGVWAVGVIVRNTRMRQGRGLCGSVLRSRSRVLEFTVSAPQKRGKKGKDNFW